MVRPLFPESSTIEKQSWMKSLTLVYSSSLPGWPPRDLTNTRKHPQLCHRHSICYLWRRSMSLCFCIFFTSMDCISPSLYFSPDMWNSLTYGNGATFQEGSLLLSEEGRRTAYDQCWCEKLFLVHFVECEWPIPTARWENTLQRRGANKMQEVRPRLWTQQVSFQLSVRWHLARAACASPDVRALQACKYVDSFFSWDLFMSVYERHFVNNLSRIMMYLWNYATRHEVIHQKHSDPRPELHDSHHVLQIVFIIGQMPSNPSSLPPYPCHGQINTTNTARDGKSLCKHLDSLADRQVDTGSGHESLSNKVLTHYKSRVFWLSTWKSLLCRDFSGRPDHHHPHLLGLHT